MLYTLLGEGELFLLLTLSDFFFPSSLRALIIWLLKTRGLEFSQQLFEFGLVHKSVYYKIKNKTKQNKNIRRKSSGIFFFYEMFRYLSTMRLQKIEAELF